MKRLLPSLTGLALALTSTHAGARDLSPLDTFTQRPGVPSFVWAERTRGANGAKGSLRGMSPVEAARAHLAGRTGLRSEAPLAAAAEAPLRRMERLTGGASLVTLGQDVDGVEIFRDSLRVLLDGNNDLVAVTGHLTPNTARSARLHFRLSPQEALTQALADVTGEPLDAGMLVDTGRGHGTWRQFDFAPALRMREQRLTRPARVKPVAFPLPDALVSAWYVEVHTGFASSTEGDAFAYVLAADDGRILFRQSLEWQDAYSYRVWADPTPPHVPHDGPQGFGGTPHLTGVPDGYQPPFVAPNLITLQNSPFSQNDPWLPAGATTLTGNNVRAYADIVSPDGFNDGDVAASPTGPGTFDHVYDVTAEPGTTAQRMASSTQLFFVNNFLHDWFYDAGFDEASGNSQTDNFGRGGLGNDVLLVEAQDWTGKNNANIEVPADGASPRMQMYVFDPRGLKKLIGNAPASLARDYKMALPTFGPQNYKLTADLALVDDGVSSRNNGCETPFVNASQLAGKIALVDDGGCAYDKKAKNAQENGAVGLIITNLYSSSPPAWTFTGPDTAAVTIPGMSVGNTDGNAFKSALAAGTPVTLTLLREELVRRDGTLDNTIVAHEWAHYLSARLVGNGVGLTNKQGGGLGEGWSDFVALLMLVREEDAQVPSNAGFGGVYVTGGYAFGGGSNNGFYFGIRRYPYSTDFSKNPLTLRHIQNGVPLPENVPIFPTDADNSAVHSVGEVWAQMLWECYVSLLRDTDRLTFDEAQQRMKEYLVTGLKLTPSSPTLLEARDAVLAAARARDERDYRLFLRAFARRGAGAGAVGPARTSADLVGVTESYESGEAPTFVSATLDDGLRSCDSDGKLDNGETGRLRVTLKNLGDTEFRDTRVTVSTTSDGVLLANGGSLTFPAIAPGQSATAELAVTLDGPNAVQPLTFTLSYGDSGPGSVGMRTKTFESLANYTFASGTSRTETVESSDVFPTWTSSARTGFPYPSTTVRWVRAENGAAAHSFHVADAPVLSDLYLVSPALTVSSTEDFGFTFRHRYWFDFKDTNSFDGGILEISTDNGTNWTDLGTVTGASISPGYDTTLSNLAGTANPLRGKKTFARKSAGYPAWTQATVSLGRLYAGRTVRLRFRVGTDESNGTSSSPEGWSVDDIAFSGLSNTPFSGMVADTVTCNRPPRANAGTDLVVEERQTARLQGSGSDTDSTSLQFSWKQVVGTNVALTDGDTLTPSFTAPEVTKDEVLTFELTVSDGSLSASDTVHVKVLQKNRPPVITPFPGMDVDEGKPVELTASATDPEGESVSYAWTKTSGPDVVLSGVETPTLSFIAPEVPADATLVFEVVVSDGTASSAPYQVTVGVRHVNKDPVPDAGTGEVDAGTGEVDAGTGEVDAGTGEVDAGTGEVDAGTGVVDAGTGVVDAGTGGEQPDAGSGENPGGGKDDPSGCGCAAGSSSGTASLLPMMLLALGFISRRRRV